MRYRGFNVGFTFYFHWPLCGAALTFFATQKKVSKERRFETANPKCPSTA
jgi:hypothetical protein